MDEPTPDDAATVLLAYIQRKCLQLGYESVYDLTLAAILEETDTRVSLKEQGKIGPGTTALNARIAQHGKDLSRFITLASQIEDDKFQMEVDVDIATALFRMGVKKQMTAEITKLCLALHKSPREFSRLDITNFEFDKFISIIEKNAPFVWTMFQEIFAPHGQRSGEHAQETVEQNHEAGDRGTVGRLGGRGRGKAKGKGKRTYSVADLEDEPDHEAPMPVEEYVAVRSAKRRKRSARDKEMVAAMGLSVCCFGLSREANYLQGENIGFLDSVVGYLQRSRDNRLLSRFNYDGTTCYGCSKQVSTVLELSSRELDASRLTVVQVGGICVLQQFKCYVRVHRRFLQGGIPTAGADKTLDPLFG